MDWIELRESKHSFIIIIINNFEEICVSIVIVMDIPITRRVVRLLYLWEAILMALTARVILIVIKILLRKSPIIIIYVNLEVCNNTSAVWEKRSQLICSEGFVSANCGAPELEKLYNPNGGPCYLSIILLKNFRMFKIESIIIKISWTSIFLCAFNALVFIINLVYIYQR